MSTSDQPQRVADLSAGGSQLTRKQLREARLTGSTPIVTPEEAEAARLQDAANAQPVPGPDAAHAPVAPEPVAPEPVAPEPVAEPGHDAEEPLTRRQLREQERIRTGSVPVHDAAAPVAPVVPPSVIPERPAAPVPAPAPQAAPAQQAPEAAPAQPEPETAPATNEMITDVPRPVYPSRRRSYEPAAVAPAPSRSAEEQDGVDDAEQGVAPVSASAVMRAEEETGRTWHATPAAETGESAAAVPAPARPAAPAPAPVEAAPVVAATPEPEPEPEQPTLWSALVAESDAAGKNPDADVAPAPDATGSSVNPAFGARVLAEQPTSPAIDSFDALIVDTNGSHHAAPNALIFQNAPTGPSLSGPVASTGEILITGSYELPAGLGSRGHADGVADGKEVDAVLVDGELAPASSPTPIAASAAIGTIKPAGEVIRPPEPEKGNKLMLALTITAGALAVALVGALIVAITTGAFS